GDFEVPAGSTLAVPAPSADAHAVPRSYVTDLVEAGTYTPSFSNESNVENTTANVAFYTRIGDIVTVYMQCSTTRTGAGTKEFEIDLPVARDGNFADVLSVSGSGAFGTG